MKLWYYLRILTTEYSSIQNKNDTYETITEEKRKQTAETVPKALSNQQIMFKKKQWYFPAACASYVLTYNIAKSNKAWRIFENLYALKYMHFLSRDKKYDFETISLS